ncbi:MAG: signal peptidase I [Chloroflexi bacterium]|nr:signal peptidase I [Chloroflexota bacterium]
MTLDSGFDALTQAILRRGSCLRFRAHGNSMSPFIRNGDVILIEPAKPGELRVGDIVFYRRAGGRHVVHRLVGLCGSNGSLVLTTKGDNMRFPDAPVSPEEVLGKVIRIEEQDRALEISGTSGRVLNRLLVHTNSNGGRIRNLLRRGLTRLWWLVGARCQSIVP